MGPHGEVLVGIKACAGGDACRHKRVDSGCRTGMTGIMGTRYQLVITSEQELDDWPLQCM